MEGVDMGLGGEKPYRLNFLNFFFLLSYAKQDLLLPQGMVLRIQGVGSSLGLEPQKDIPLHVPICHWFQNPGSKHSGKRPAQDP